MMDFKRVSVAGANCGLSAVDFGNQDKPDMVVLHGTHDHALGMYPAVASLIEHYHVVGLDLRGHGQSDKPGNYTMLAMVADLRALITALGLQNPVIVAHSMGGHIASRYAALYTDEVCALAILDGMGPPRPRKEWDGNKLVEIFRRGVTGALRQERQSRRMQDMDEALARFVQNSPGLDEECVGLIVGNGVEPHPEGGLRWRFDPSIDLMFHTYSDLDAECMAALVECPVLLVTGEHALAFWHSIKLGVNVDANWYEQEQARRRDLFQRAEWVVIPGAGHMLHYDKPLAVQRVLEQFLLGA